MSDNPFKPDDDEEIIEDLESIKELLDEDEPAEDVVPVDDDAIPTLDDAVGSSNYSTHGLADDAFKALLDDAWQDSVQSVLGDARSKIDENSEAWFPQDTDQLNSALKIRIDNSVRAWLAETLQANIGQLRQRIVSELSDEIVQVVNKKLAGARPTHLGKEPE